ncbi:MAG: signal peptidase II [Crocinitomicaceae bacterium]
MKKNILIVTLVVALILAFDQILKVYIKLNFEPGESVSVFGDWFLLQYIENQGMAFGTRFGSQMWHKLALSIFRVIAISALVYYFFKQFKKGVRLEFLVAIGLVFAGATGNLIDSMFYDFAFPYDPCMPYNHLDGSGVISNCGFFGEIETRHTGFLMGNVVDMFKFEAFWPEWMPIIGGWEVFPAIWNVADASISIGVIMVFVRQKKYFPKPAVTNSEEIINDTPDVSSEENKQEEEIN